MGGLAIWDNARLSPRENEVAGKQWVYKVNKVAIGPMESAQLRPVGTRVCAGAGLLALALAVWFLLPPRGGNIQAGDGSVQPRFVKVTRGTPYPSPRRDPSGRSINITNYSHTIYPGSRLGLSSRFGYLLSQRLVQWSLKLGVALRPITSSNFATEEDQSVLWIGYQAAAGLPFTDYLLVDEQGRKIPLTLRLSLGDTNQHHISTWTMPCLLTRGGRFDFVVEATGKKLFRLTLPRPEDN